MVLVGENETYVKAAFDSEAEIERVVLENAEALFGSASLYLAQSTISTQGGKVTIPDGIVINLRSDQWYIVEAERASHGTWEHIAPQIIAQLTAVQRTMTKQRILQAALDKVGSSEDQREAIRALGIQEIGLHGKIYSILEKLPVVAIPIDDIPADLEEWAANLKNPVKIWVIGKYAQQGGSKILYSLPDEATPTHEATPIVDTSVGTPRNWTIEELRQEFSSMSNARVGEQLMGLLDWAVNQGCFAISPGPKKAPAFGLVGKTGQLIASVTPTYVYVNLREQRYTDVIERDRLVDDLKELGLYPHDLVAASVKDGRNLERRPGEFDEERFSDLLKVFSRYCRTPA